MREESAKRRVKGLIGHQTGPFHDPDSRDAHQGATGHTPEIRFHSAVFALLAKFPYILAI
jgi:hypothetical protein